jgi:hypothetical protein
MHNFYVTINKKEQKYLNTLYDQFYEIFLDDDSEIVSLIRLSHKLKFAKYDESTQILQLSLQENEYKMLAFLINDEYQNATSNKDANFMLNLCLKFCITLS